MNDLRKRFPIYSKLLYLYPAEYRKQFGEQLLQTTADMLDHAASRPERLEMWAAVARNIPGSIGRQQIISLGGHMNVSKKVAVSILWVAICVGAIFLFPELRKIGMDWKNNAGFLRLVYLSLFIVVFIAASPIMAVLTWFDRPKSLYSKLASL